METITGNLDSLVEDLGCGKFQIILSVIMYLAYTPPCWTYFFMTFGLYSPGWRCLDNDYNITTLPNGTTYYHNATIPTSATPEYASHSCAVFDACRRVEFDPETSTVVTEFGLLCGNAWKASLSLTMYMVGAAVAYVLSGIVGDMFGRKVTVHTGLFLHAVLSFASMYSNSWQMFAAIDFFLGFSVSFSSLITVLINEFVPHAWRLRVTSFPSWTIAVTIFSVLAMLTRNWKTLRLITCLASGAIFLMLFWAPKSLRFLSARDKKKEFLKVLEKVARYNKIEIPGESAIDLVMEENSSKDVNDTSTPFPILSIFRKGYIITSLVIGISFMSIDMIYFAMSLGISALPGDFYENLLIISVTELPGNLFAAMTGNCAGRRVSILATLVISSLFTFGVVVFDLLTTGGTRTVGTLACLVVAKMFIGAAWYVQVTTSMEAYPTVVRSTVTCYCRMMSMVGGVVAPSLIPTDSPGSFYVCYIVMAGILFLCGLLALLLPETRGKALYDTWKEADEAREAEAGKSVRSAENAAGEDGDGGGIGGGGGGIGGGGIGGGGGGIGVVV